MGSVLVVFRRIRHKTFEILHICVAIYRYSIQRLWPCILWIPGIRLLSRAVAYIPRLGRPKSRTEPELSEEKRPERRYSSDGENESDDRQRDQYGDNRNHRYWKPPFVVEQEEEFAGDEYRVEKSDEFYCGYDSTWETEETEDSPTWKSPPYRAHRHYKFSRFENAARDMWNYRHDYPNLHRKQHFSEQEHDAKPNLNFYLGNIPSSPDGVYISDFHNEWKGKYGKLEHVHTFIQWLFPLQEPGVNYEAKTLTQQEIKEFLENDLAKENLLKSYELMLDFYGIELTDREAGEVKRASHWSDRFQNLNNNTHNNLRITRILKCLGTLGYRHYQVPLVRFFLEETLVHGELPRVKDSVLSYFLFAVLDKRERRKLLKFAYENYEPKEEFVWCPKKIQRRWSNLRQNQMNNERAYQGNTPVLY